MHMSSWTVNGKEFAVLVSRDRKNPYLAVLKADNAWHKVAQFSGEQGLKDFCELFGLQYNYGILKQLEAIVGKERSAEE